MHINIYICYESQLFMRVISSADFNAQYAIYLPLQFNLITFINIKKPLTKFNLGFFD